MTTSQPKPLTLLQVQYIENGDNVYKVLVPKDLHEVKQSQLVSHGNKNSVDSTIDPIICNVQAASKFKSQQRILEKAEQLSFTSFSDLSTQFKSVKSLLKFPTHSVSEKVKEKTVSQNHVFPSQIEEHFGHEQDRWKSPDLTSSTVNQVRADILTSCTSSLCSEVIEDDPIIIKEDTVFCTEDNVSDLNSATNPEQGFNPAPDMFENFGVNFQESDCVLNTPIEVEECDGPVTGQLQIEDTYENMQKVLSLWSDNSLEEHLKEDVSNRVFKEMSQRVAYTLSSFQDDSQKFQSVENEVYSSLFSHDLENRETSQSSESSLPVQQDVSIRPPLSTSLPAHCWNTPTTETAEETYLTLNNISKLCNDILQTPNSNQDTINKNLMSDVEVSSSDLVCSLPEHQFLSSDDMSQIHINQENNDIPLIDITGDSPVRKPKEFASSKSPSPNSKYALLHEHNYSRLKKLKKLFQEEQPVCVLGSVWSVNENPIACESPSQASVEKDVNPEIISDFTSNRKKNKGTPKKDRLAIATEGVESTKQMEHLNQPKFNYGTDKLQTDCNPVTESIESAVEKYFEDQKATTREKAIKRRTTGNMTARKKTSTRKKAGSKKTLVRKNNKDKGATSKNKSTVKGSSLKKTRYKRLNGSIKSKRNSSNNKKNETQTSERDSEKASSCGSKDVAHPDTFSKEVISEAQSNRVRCNSPGQIRKLSLDSQQRDKNRSVSMLIAKLAVRTGKTVNKGEPLETAKPSSQPPVSLLKNHGLDKEAKDTDVVQTCSKQMSLLLKKPVIENSLYNTSDKIECSDWLKSICKKLGIPTDSSSITYGTKRDIANDTPKENNKDCGGSSTCLDNDNVSEEDVEIVTVEQADKQPKHLEKTDAREVQIETDHERTSHIDERTLVAENNNSKPKSQSFTAMNDSRTLSGAVVKSPCILLDSRNQSSDNVINKTCLQLDRQKLNTPLPLLSEKTSTKEISLDSDYERSSNTSKDTRLTKSYVSKQKDQMCATTRRKKKDSPSTDNFSYENPSSSNIDSSSTRLDIGNGTTENVMTDKTNKKQRKPVKCKVPESANVIEISVASGDESCIDKDKTSVSECYNSKPIQFALNSHTSHKNVLKQDDLTLSNREQSKLNSCQNSLAASTDNSKSLLDNEKKSKGSVVIETDKQKKKMPKSILSDKADKREILINRKSEKGSPTFKYTSLAERLRSKINQFAQKHDTSSGNTSNDINCNFSNSKINSISTRTNAESSFSASAKTNNKKQKESLHSCSAEQISLGKCLNKIESSSFGNRVDEPILSNYNRNNTAEDSDSLLDYRKGQLDKEECDVLKTKQDFERCVLKMNALSKRGKVNSPIRRSLVKDQISNSISKPVSPYSKDLHTGKSGHAHFDESLRDADSSECESDDDDDEISRIQGSRRICPANKQTTESLNAEYLTHYFETNKSLFRKITLSDSGSDLYEHVSSMSEDESNSDESNLRVVRNFGSDFGPDSASVKNYCKLVKNNTRLSEPNSHKCDSSSESTSSSFSVVNNRIKQDSLKSIKHKRYKNSSCRKEDRNNAVYHNMSRRIDDNTDYYSSGEEIDWNEYFTTNSERNNPGLPIEGELLRISRGEAITLQEPTTPKKTLSYETRTLKKQKSNLLLSTSSSEILTKKKRLTPSKPVRPSSCKTKRLQKPLKTKELSQPTGLTLDPYLSVVIRPCFVKLERLKEPSIQSKTKEKIKPKVVLKPKRKSKQENIDTLLSAVKTFLEREHERSARKKDKEVKRSLDVIFSSLGNISKPKSPVNIKRKRKEKDEHSSCKKMSTEVVLSKSAHEVPYTERTRCSLDSSSTVKKVGIIAVDVVPEKRLCSSKSPKRKQDPSSDQHRLEKQVHSPQKPKTLQEKYLDLVRVFKNAQGCTNSCK